ncbi:HAD family hydrolase [Plantactinospora soyae]|uniref:HAD family hydrolase n=1 Tax=Plantactinospora soyae TaxID=1544732 RepID=UPI00298ED625|nr:HAD family hydrolase [Plantactinospora soyae]
MLFDLDNTLVDRAAGLRLWAQEFCVRRGLGQADVEWMVEADGDGLVPKEIFFGELRDRFRLPDSVSSLWAQYRVRHPALIPVFPGVPAGLTRLRAEGWKVGLVTNGFADVQLRTITGSGMGAYLDGWAISGAEDVRKPDRRLFEIAARRCGTTLSDGGWMIGDSATSDVGGGQAAGLRTVWVDRGGAWPSGLPVPDHVTPSVVEAFAVLLAG